MKLYFKQRFTAFLASYDIYDEAGNTVYTVESQASWGHLMHIRGANGNYLATVKQKFWTWRSQFEIYIGPDFAGTIRRDGSLFSTHYAIDYRGWAVEGNFMESEYAITDASGMMVAAVSKEFFHLTDQYCIEILNPDDALHVLCFVLAIDAEKASRST